MKFPDVPADQMLAFESEAFNEGAEALDQRSTFDQASDQLSQDIPYLWPQPWQPPDLPPIPLKADEIQGPPIPQPPVRDDWGRGQDYGGPASLPSATAGSSFLPMGGFAGSAAVMPSATAEPLGLSGDQQDGGFLARVSSSPPTPDVTQPTTPDQSDGGAGFTPPRRRCWAISASRWPSAPSATGGRSGPSIGSIARRGICSTRRSGRCRPLQTQPSADGAAAR